MKSLFTFSSYLHLISILTIGNCAELSILYQPSFLRFNNKNAISDVSSLKTLITSTLGYTVDNAVDATNALDNLKLTDPFTYANGVLIFEVPSVGGMNIPSVEKFQLLQDEDLEQTWEILMEKTLDRFPKNKQTIVKISLDDIITVDGISALVLLENFNANDDIDEKVLKEVESIKYISKEILGKVKKDGAPHIYWITLPHLYNVTSVYGENSLNAIEAKKLLSLAMLSSAQSFAAFYDKKFLALAVATDNLEPGHRFKRDVPVQETFRTLKELNVADNYNENFPVIFNIMLWLSVALIFALVSISLAIGNMDPGRDSIIYRMTSTRMKKDN